MKLYIISNRLPVKVSNQDGTLKFSRSEGGLATGLKSLQTSCETHWIGWPGLCAENEEEKKEITTALNEMHYHPVFLSEEQIKNYYEGYSNSTIWPLCHYFFVYTLYKNTFWQSYCEVNRLFCEAVSRVVEPGDRVWVQDYQLMLLPDLLRQACPELTIGYFHHIPFPSYELFRILPERAEILKGLLGADFIAFHTCDYMRHFLSAVERVLHLSFNVDEVRCGNRIVRVGALPMGINYDLYHNASSRPEVRKAIDHTRQLFGNHKLILSVDRLDYSKGILHRLSGFASFLEHHPEYHGQVTLAMVIVPSRDQVGSYAELKTRVDEEIGSINGRYSTMDWTPVCYFYHGFSLDELTAMYYVADIALVTPLRDGMNLVAKEYVATKGDNTGVLILSEMAGAAVELTDALQINPNDTSQIERAIGEALQMPEAEQKERLKRMQAIVSYQTVNKWAADFMSELEEASERNSALRRKKVDSFVTDRIRHRYNIARHRLIMLDYDGTLAPICQRPEQAAPTPELIAALRQLTADAANHVVINSGRDKDTLEAWLGMLPLDMAAEHGAYYKEHGVWHKSGCQVEWGDEILSTLQLFVRKTPRSHIETKETAIAWHYRESDIWLGALRAQQLVEALYPLCMKRGLRLMQGDKVVELKPADSCKGSEVERRLRGKSYDFILAIGDDTTDDDMFNALGHDDITIKVGAVSNAARYNIPQQAEVLPFLTELAGGRRMSGRTEGNLWWQKIKKLLGKG